MFLPVREQQGTTGGFLWVGRPWGSWRLNLGFIWELLGGWWGIPDLPRSDLWVLGHRLGWHTRAEELPGHSAPLCSRKGKALLTGGSCKLLGWWLPTAASGKRGVAENPISINYFRSWDTAVLLFGIYLFWLRVGLEPPFLSIIPKTISAKLGCFPQGRFTLHICTGVVFLTLQNAAPSPCPRGERSPRLSLLAGLRQSGTIPYCLRPIRREDKAPFYSFAVPHGGPPRLEWQ